MRTTLFDLVCQEGIVDEDHPEEEHIEDPYDVERILEVKDTQEVQVHSPIAQSFNVIGTLELGFKKPALKKNSSGGFGRDPVLLLLPLPASQGLVEFHNC